MDKDANNLILGIILKENCPDICNTMVVSIHTTLSDFSHNIATFDPWVDAAAVAHEYDINVVNVLSDDLKFDSVILAVSHKQ